MSFLRSFRGVRQSAKRFDNLSDFDILLPMKTLAILWECFRTHMSVRAYIQSLRGHAPYAGKTWGQIVDLEYTSMRKYYANLEAQTQEEINKFLRIA